MWYPYILKYSVYIIIKYSNTNYIFLPESFAEYDVLSDLPERLLEYDVISDLPERFLRVESNVEEEFRS